MMMVVVVVVVVMMMMMVMTMMMMALRLDWLMAEHEDADDERESSSDEMYSSTEQTSTSWSVMEQQQQQLTDVNVMEEFNKLEIDVSLQRKQVTSDSQFGQYTHAHAHAHCQQCQRALSIRLSLVNDSILKLDQSRLNDLTSFYYRATRMHSADYAIARCLSVCHTPVFCGHR